MAREIKFRAFDKVQGHFVYFELGTMDGKMWHTPPIYSNHVIEPWEQFTGLHDKNGKEIYEGDILGTATGHNLTIEWNEPTASFLLNDLGSLVEKLPDGAWFPVYKYSEVIGNIHENPELLQ